MLVLFEIVLFGSVALYAFGLLAFLVGLYKPNLRRIDQVCPVSVVVAVRNEAVNIANLLSDLTKQTYPRYQMEIIIVDDHSTDLTANIVQAWADKDDRIRLISVKGSDSGKKHALSTGIEASKGEIILTTDGDCRVKSSWIQTMVSYFCEDVGMVVGFSQLGYAKEKQTFFQKLQSLDFLALMASAQGSLNLGLPLACSGQNLAYRRSAFDQVKGFQRIAHRVSGDDVLFLQLVKKITDWKICFAHSSDAYNASPAESTWRQFINQRKRWASNGAYQFMLNKVFFLYVVVTFLANLCLLSGAFLGAAGLLSISIVLPILLIKLFSELCLVIKGIQVFKRTVSWRVIILWLLLQIPYVVYVGILGSFGRFTWKARIHDVGSQMRPMR